jgi:hypothetical protein
MRSTLDPPLPISLSLDDPMTLIDVMSCFLKWNSLYLLNSLSLDGSTNLVFNYLNTFIILIWNF